MLVRINPPGSPVLLEDRDLVAERHEVVRHGQRCRAAPMQATRLPFLSLGILVAAPSHRPGGRRRPA